MPCVFGCAARDDLAHYIVCTRLWRTVGQTSRLPISRDPLVRLCVQEPTPHSAALLGTAFTVYHAIRRGHANDVAQAAQSRNFVTLASVALNLARHSRRHQFARVAPEAIA